MLSSKKLKPLKGEIVVLFIVAVALFIIGRTITFYGFELRHSLAVNLNGTSVNDEVFSVRDYPKPGKDAIIIPSVSYDIWGQCGLSGKDFPVVRSIFSQHKTLESRDGLIRIDKPQSLYLLSEFEKEPYYTKVSYDVCGIMSFSSELPVKMLPTQLCKIFSFLVFNYGNVSICGRIVEKNYVNEYCGTVPANERDRRIVVNPFTRGVDKTFLFWNKAIAAYSSYSPAYMVDDGEILPRADYMRGVKGTEPAIYYVVMSQVHEFIVALVPLITHPFIIITGSSDQPAPYMIEKRRQENTVEVVNNFLNNNSYLVAWFAQDMDLFHPKIVPIPIGFDFHTYGGHHRNPDLSKGFGSNPAHQDEYLRTMVCSPKQHDVRQTVFLNFNRGGRPSREALLNYADAVDPAETFFHKLKDLTNREDVWLMYRNEGFVASPFGFGKDCHRTWESLTLGTPVIHEREPYLEVLFKHLPVFTIKTWSEVTRQRLKQWTSQIYRNWDSYEWEIIRNAYWINLAHIMLDQNSTQGYYNISYVDGKAVTADVSLFARFRV